MFSLLVYFIFFWCKLGVPEAYLPSHWTYVTETTVAKSFVIDVFLKYASALIKVLKIFFMKFKKSLKYLKQSYLEVEV